MEGLDMMDWMLEEAKKKPMEIHHDFDTRFRVWVDQIIPSRIDAIRQCGGDVEYMLRMLLLLRADAIRLRKSALVEWQRCEDTEYYNARMEIINYVVAGTFAVYIDEVKQ